MILTISNKKINFYILIFNKRLNNGKKPVSLTHLIPLFLLSIHMITISFQFLKKF